MKNKVIKGVLSFYVMTLIIACNTKKAEPVVIDKEQIKKEIQARENEYAAIYNSGEMKSIGYYGEDAISFPQNHAPLVGKKAIVEYLTANMDSLVGTYTVSLKTNEVFVSADGNQVLEIGYYSFVDVKNTPVNTGNYMSLFFKIDGKYVCHRDMSTSDIPLE